MAQELQFFLDAPVAYGDGIVAAAYGAAITLLGSTQTNTTIIYKRCSGVCALQVRQLGVQLTTSISGGTAVVLTAAVRPIAGAGTVASGTRIIGTMTIGATAVAGDVIYVVWSDADRNMNPGEELIVELTTKSTTGGAGYVSATYTPSIVGPTSGGTATVPKNTTKPFGVGAAQGAASGTIRLVSTGTTGN